MLGSSWCSVDDTDEVPAAIEVVASSDNSRVTLTGIDGAVNVNAVNGPVDVSDVAGDLPLENDNGRIPAGGIDADTVVASTDNGSVSLTFARAPRSVEATSDNGSVEVVLPPGDESYRVDITTDNGDVTARYGT